MAIVTIYNSEATYSDIELLRDTVKDKDYLYIKNQEYKGSWYRELPNGSYINLDDSYSAKKEENDIKTNDPSFFWVPVWTANIEYMGEEYYIVMNGQNGKMAGIYRNKIKINRKKLRKIGLI